MKKKKISGEAQSKKTLRRMQQKKKMKEEDSSDSSSSDSDASEKKKKKIIVKKKKVIVKKKIIRKKKKKGEDAEAQAEDGKAGKAKLTTEQRAALIMARANANRPSRTGLSSDDEDGPVLPKLPGQGDDSDSSESSEDDVVVPEFGAELRDTPKRSVMSERERQAMKEIEELKRKRIALQKSV